MKKNIISLPAVMFLIFFINHKILSQDMGYGFKGGVTLSYFYDNSIRSYSNFDIGTKTGTGFNAGVFVDIISSENFVVSSELYFNRKTASSDPKINGNIIDLFPEDGIDVLLDYLDYGVPIRYGFTKTKAVPYVYLTPRVNFYLGNDISNPGDTVAQSVKEIISEGLTKFGFGFSGGAGVDIRLQKSLSLLFEIQFSPDLFDTYYSEDFSIRGNTLEVRTGLKFY